MPVVSPGQTVGPYVIEALIAEGGMGAVYRARNRVTGQLRALKVVRPALATDREFVDRFVREATVASQLRHPNLVETLEPGIDGDIVYLPMELLEGETLSARLKRIRVVPLAEAAAVVLAVAEAVQLLHDRGIIHRDLKPQNIFLARQPDGREIPKVIDFGTARDIEDDEQTRTGLVIGSPYYMALEQAEGRRDLDGRADQYALAVIAYQMVTGARPYESDDTRSALAKLLRGEPYLLPSQLHPGIPPAVEQVITRGLARDREQRYPRIVDFGQAFAIACKESRPMGPKPGAAFTPPPAPQPTRRPSSAPAAPSNTPGGPTASSTSKPSSVPPPETPVPLPVSEPSGTPGPFGSPPPTPSEPARQRMVGLGVAAALVGLAALLAGAVALWMRRREDTITVIRLPEATAPTTPHPVVGTPAPTAVDGPSVPASAPAPASSPQPAAAVAVPSTPAPPSVSLVSMSGPASPAQTGASTAPSPAPPGASEASAAPLRTAPASASARPSDRAAPLHGDPRPASTASPVTDRSPPAPRTESRARAPAAGERSRGDDLPCGATTGIPCLD